MALESLTQRNEFFYFFIFFLVCFFVHFDRLPLKGTNHRQSSAG